MSRIIERLAEIATPYQALLCDLWGCLHDGIRPFPEAVAALRAFRADGKMVVLLTNAPRPASWVGRQLAGMGLPDDAYDFVVSSGDATQIAAMHGMVGRRIWHLGPEKDEPFFTELPPELRTAPPLQRVSLEQAEGIICTGPFDDVNDQPEVYRAQFLLAKTRGLKMLCANPDIVVDQGDQRLLCAGALAAYYTEMGGEALWFGKPHPPIYDLARRKLAEALGRDVPDDRILAVGDGIGTDIAGAMSEDLDSLFVSGGIAAAETGTTHSGPDPVKLRAYLDRHGISPLASIATLR